MTVMILIIKKSRVLVLDAKGRSVTSVTHHTVWMWCCRCGPGLYMELLYRSPLISGQFWIFLLKCAPARPVPRFGSCQAGISILAAPDDSVTWAGTSIMDDEGVRTVIV